jgi:hypothetical protein
MSQVTRDVILDLLPLYLANEASTDTRDLVSDYLETDPELARMAEKPAAIQWPDDIPFPLTTEDKMEAYKEAQRLMFRRTVVWAVLIAFTLLMVLGTVACAALLMLWART